MEDCIVLTKNQVNFLKVRFNTQDPDVAIDLFIEFLVTKHIDPMNMLNYLMKTMAKENN